MIIKGFFNIKRIVEIAPPNAIEPVSPINTLAGYLLYFKNPINPPIKATENTDILSWPVLKETSAKKIITIIVTEVFNPSKPSVKFTAFVKATK